MKPGLEFLVRQQTTCSKQKVRSQHWVVLLLSLYMHQRSPPLELLFGAAIAFVPASSSSSNNNNVKKLQIKLG
jgi:hypothetical protein